MEEIYNYFCFVPHKYWCDLLSTTKAKYNRNWYVSQIKILAASKAAPSNSDRVTFANVPHNNKAISAILPVCKKQCKKNPRINIPRVIV